MLLKAELTSVWSLSAEPSQAQPTALGSMTTLDEAGASALGGGVEVVHGLLVQLILRAAERRKRAKFACSVDRKSGVEWLQRTYSV